jgi:hypothetical protein
VQDLPCLFSRLDTRIADLLFAGVAAGRNGELSRPSTGRQFAQDFAGIGNHLASDAFVRAI